MPDVEKILKLVADGVLTAEEADEILSATADGWRSSSTRTDFTPPQPPEPPSPPQAAGSNQGTPRHIRIEVTEGGKRVVNLRVPMNVVGWASSLVPGLSDEQTDRIRSAMASGQYGPIVDITDDDDGSRVLIVSE
jgi:hypothetical protein